MSAQILHLASGDHTALQYPVAAVVLLWSSLLDETQRIILQQTTSVGGLPPLISLHEQLGALIKRTRSY